MVGLGIEQRSERGSRGVGDEEVEAAEPLANLGEHRADRVAIFEVRCDCHCAPAALGDRVDGSLGSLAVALVVDDDRRTLAGEVLGRGAADPPRCAGDQRDPFGEAHHL